MINNPHQRLFSTPHIIIPPKSNFFLGLFASFGLVIAESRFVSVFSDDSAAVINKNYKLELYAKSGSKDTKRSTESH